jgi:hypothetical protein
MGKSLGRFCEVGKGVGGGIRLGTGVGFESWVGLGWGEFGLGEIFDVELGNFLSGMRKESFMTVKKWEKVGQNF